MLIFNVASRKATVGKNKGKTVYYAQPIPTTRLTARAVEDHIVEKTSLTRGDVRHAITSLAEVVRWALAEGIAVDLADLGSFKVEAYSKLVASEAEVTSANMKAPVIRFFPRKEMRKYAKSVAISVRNPALSGATSPSVSAGGTEASSPVGGGDTGTGIRPGHNL